MEHAYMDVYAYEAISDALRIERMKKICLGGNEGGKKERKKDRRLEAFSRKKERKKVRKKALGLLSKSLSKLAQERKNPRKKERRRRRNSSSVMDMRKLQTSHPLSIAKPTLATLRRRP
jgi:hypothetical protein